MPDASALQRIIETAGQAASSGDFASAESLLRDAARLQEAGLGPLHPDLAITFNNLGVVCEKANKLADAERFYRHASAIASASLDSQHPLVTASHNNLRDFCYAHGGPPERPATTDADAEAVVAHAEQTHSAPASEATDSATPLTTVPTRSRMTRSSRPLVCGALVAMALLVALATWFTRTPPDPRTADERPPAPTQESVSVPPSASPSKEGSSRPPAVDRPPERPVTPAIDAPTRAAVAVAGTVDVQVIEAALCRSLSTSASSWQCTTPADPAAPGLLYFYTRIAAPRNASVHHRWYRNGRLRQDIELAVGVNPAAGYRTYSRQTVDAEGSGEWRVELVTADGVLLREERIVVR
jgi:hypothetical protein